MTCHVGEGIVICDGVSGWRVEPAKHCPWCLETRRCLGTPIFGGYCGSDYICGTCGSYWSEEDDTRFRKLTEEEREQNIARVTSVADPKCWKCHDTGDAGDMMDEPGANPCDCRASGEKAGEATPPPGTAETQERQG